MEDIPSDFLASGKVDSAVRRLRGDLIGQQIGAYQVTELLGVGGMGEVYRARDTKLGREVAIKILPSMFTTDPDRLARFRREARMLASLNHPNIAAIHDVDESSGTPALVLELVEGQTLAELLLKGPLPISDALTYAGQIAEAVEAAHERGIVHRDLKPSNIKVTPNRTVKVLDFGLAKASDALAVDWTSAASFASREGAVVGTVAYMSPEQARGHAVDKRSDIWAFGCVLYEMLTGAPPFHKDTTSDTVAAILDREPDWTALPDKTPQAARRLLSRCLEKDATLRLRDIGDARLEIREALATSARPQQQESQARRSAVWLAAGLLTIVSVATAVAWMMRPSRPAAAAAIRFSFVPPAMTNAFAYSISPDGRTVVIAGGDSTRPRMLYVRPLESVEARPVPGTEGALSRVFWSPDSRYMGFWSGNTEQLKIVGLNGNPPRVLADVKGGFGGGTWSSDDVIIFSDQAILYRVPASGGTPVALRHRSTQERAWWPQFLPDARRYLYLAADQTSKHVVVGSLGSDEITEIMPTDSRAEYAPPHFLVFTRQQTLLAHRFDASTLMLSGEPTVLAEGVLHNRNGNAAFSVSRQGTLTYRAGGPQTYQPSLVWIDRTDKSVKPLQVPFGPAWIRLSPDGTRVTFSDFSSTPPDVWVYDLERDQKVPLATDPNADHFPVWSPDGLRVGFDSSRTGALTHVIFERRADAATPEQILVPPEPGASYGLLDWTDDFLVFLKGSPPARTPEIWAQRLSGDRKPFLVQRLDHETPVALSPDGRWLARVVNQAGTDQVIVESFPDPARRRQQISRNGGDYPRWRRDGRELFYLDHNWRMIVVPVAADGTFGVAKSLELFTAPGLAFPPHVMGYPYDVAADGKRFLFSVLGSPTAPITVVVNWQSALRSASE